MTHSNEAENEDLTGSTEPVKEDTDLEFDTEDLTTEELEIALDS
jgi:hypothetical protein